MTHPGPGLTLRQAALITGFGLLTMVVAGIFAELLAYGKLVNSSDMAATVDALRAQRGLAVTGIFCYLVVLLGDLLVAWSLYWFFRPAHRVLSLLAAWTRLVYTVLALSAVWKYLDAFRLVHSPTFGAALSKAELQTQVGLLIAAFRYEWGLSLSIFGLYLCLLAYLIWRAGYVPTWLAIPVGIAGAGWVLDAFGPLLLPGVDLGFLMITMFGELVFMVWLLIRGWSLQETGLDA